MAEGVLGCEIGQRGKIFGSRLFDRGGGVWWVGRWEQHGITLHATHWQQFFAFCSSLCQTYTHQFPFLNTGNSTLA